MLLATAGAANCVESQEPLPFAIHVDPTRPVNDGVSVVGQNFEFFEHRTFLPVAFNQSREALDSLTEQHW